jgi:hypothetical protein
MKFLFSLLVACNIASLLNANILTVSNHAGYPGQYNTIQSAVNAANAGDTIYIYPSPVVYNETVNSSQRLVIIGSGANPQRPSGLLSYVFSINLTSTAASNSVIMGLYITGSIVCGSDVNHINNLVVSDCQFNAGSNYFFGSNILIENCILSSNNGLGGSLQMRSASSGNILQNNYFHGSIHLRPGTNTIIRNNIFASGDVNTNAFAYIQNGEAFGSSVKILNNIFFKSNIAPPGVADACEYKNNVYYLTNNSAPSNAQSSGNINADPQFVNYPALGASFSFNYDYHLQPTSPGINYGTDNNDIGMWGGLAPVNKGFEPPIPRIYQFTVNNPNVPAGGTIQLTIKATKAQ